MPYLKTCRSAPQRPSHKNAVSDNFDNWVHWTGRKLWGKAVEAPGHLIWKSLKTWAKIETKNWCWSVRGFGIGKHIRLGYPNMFFSVVTKPDISYPADRSSIVYPIFIPGSHRTNDTIVQLLTVRLHAACCSAHLLSKLNAPLRRNPYTEQPHMLVPPHHMEIFCFASCW